MFFCPDCNTLCKVVSSKSIFLSCHACSYTSVIDNSTEFRFKENFTITSSATDDVNNFICDENKFGNKSEVECPKCGHNEALFKEVQTRSADEPMTIFYRCCSCEHNWKE